MRVLKVSTARDISVFMASSTDHVTGKTGLTLTITAGKAGAAFASITPTVTERGTGWYTLSLTASHTDTLGDLAFHITGALADPSDFISHVVAYDFNSATLGLGAATVSVVSPVAASGTVTLVHGDDYLAADSRSLDYTFSGVPSLTGATVTMGIRREDRTTNDLTLTGSVLSATQVRFEPTSAQTLRLTPGADYAYDIQALLTVSAHVTTLQRGTLVVSQDYATP